MNSRALNTSFSGSMYNQEMRPLDYTYGPWDSVEQMMSELNVSIGEIPNGLTVGVYENGTVIEYWNPIEGIGFFKKTTGGSVQGNAKNYTDAVENFAIPENSGCFVYVENPEPTIEEMDTEGGMKHADQHPAGLYLIVGEGEIVCMATNIWYGDFPEDERMGDDEVREVLHDGAARVRDVYRRLKKHQLWADKNIRHLNSHVQWMVSDIDKMDEEFRHIFISKVENTYGKITLIHTDLDTKEILMSGHVETDDENQEVFLTVEGTNIGNYKNGDKIYKGDSLEDVLKNIFITTLIPSKYELPKVEILSGLEKETIEIGDKYSTILDIQYTDGLIQTYLDAENEDDGKMVDAGCEPTYSLWVKKPGEEDFEQLQGQTSIDNYVLDIEGEYIFKLVVNYSQSTTLAINNRGGKEPDFIIPAGTLEIERPIYCKYKVWANKINDKNRGLVFEENDELSDVDVLKYGEQSWLSKNETHINKMFLNDGEGIYIICPNTCKVIFDTKIMDDVLAIKGGSYMYTLPDETQMEYRLWYMLNPGLYRNIRMIDDTYLDDVE